MKTDAMVTPSSMESVAALQKINADLQQSLQDHQRQRVQYEQQIESLQRQLEWFKRQLFGRKSEKRINELASGQLSIADVLTETPPVPETVQTQSIRYERAKNHKNQLDGTPEDSGLRFDESVPVQEIALSAPELSGADADQYEVISTKTSYRLGQRPGSYVVLKYTRPVLKHKDSGEITNTPAPLTVLDKSFADVSFLSGMLVDKFLYHLPLYRQHQRLAASGIRLSRTTLTNLTHRSIQLLAPVYEAQHRSVLLSKTLAMDETPIKAGRKKPGKMQQAWYWPIYGDRDEVVFSFSRTHGSRHITDQLQGFRGTLLSDGNLAYARYAKSQHHIVHAQCWAHARRTFERAKEIEPEAVGTALERIGMLYEIEEQIRDNRLTGQKKLDYRTRHSYPVVDAFFGWCYAQRQRLDLVNTNPLSKALKYVHKREESLKVYLSDPEVPIDTNHLERALRVIPMGRKNWLFCWTEIGAELVGIIQSLLVTCRLHDVNSYTYLVDVLQRISTHPMSKVDELIPRNWKQHFADNPLTSDIQI